jgi:hypothetical protein
MSADSALAQIKTQRLMTPFGDDPSPQTPEQIEVIKSFRVEQESIE